MSAPDGEKVPPGGPRAGFRGRDRGIGGGTARRLVRPVVLALGLAAGACGFTSGDRRAIEGVLAEQSAAWNRGDLDGFLRAYEPTPALVFTAGGAVERGFDAARARYLERYGARGAETMGHLEFEILDVRGLARGAAVVLGRWRLTQTEQAGAGVFTLALVRDAHGWRIVHDHTSLDADAPATSAAAAASASSEDQKQPDKRDAPEL